MIRYRKLEATDDRVYTSIWIYDTETDMERCIWVKTDNPNEENANDEWTSVVWDIGGIECSD